jgi:glycosyltransferase involved in cell wall biosynthesis
VIQVRNVAEVDRLSDVRAVSPSAAQATVLFVGSRYEPNIQGVRWFVREVWPSVVAQVPRATFRIVGHGMDKGLFGDLPSGVAVVGRVEDVGKELMDARAFVSPVFFGGGTPNKVLESAAGGRPTVISKYVAETLGDVTGFAVADGSSEWVDAIVNYLVDPSAADSDGLQAYQNVDMNFSPTRWHSDMLSMEAAVFS